MTTPFIVQLARPPRGEVNSAVTSIVPVPRAPANFPVPPTNVTLYVRLANSELAGSNVAVPSVSNFKLFAPSEEVSVQGLLLNILMGWPALVGR